MAAETAYNILKDEYDKKHVEILERVSTEAIGVMQNQGIYGLYLFLDSRKQEKKQAEQLWRSLENLARKLLDLRTKNIALEIVNNREHQMLIFELFERTLTYIRFSAKAKEG
jgi:hypothetical protein